MTIDEVTLSRILRRERRRVIAMLLKRIGGDRLELAEEATQEAMIRALDVWPERGVPEDPFAWLATVARNHAIDAFRRAARFRLATPSIAETLESLAEEREQPMRALETIADDQLRMIVMCCHPSLKPSAQVALTLNVAAGFRASEIARAFFLPESTIAQRIVRAKRMLRERAVSLETPPRDELAKRLDAVLGVIYLCFNEGYTPHDGERVLRGELMEEAIRLVTEVCDSPLVGSGAAGDAFGRAQALRALVLLQASRLPSRLDDSGALVPLSEQDRSRWRTEYIAEGLRALALARSAHLLSSYHVLAGIAACHATARSHAETPWREIVTYYDVLSTIDGTPVVRLNRAVAVGMAEGPASALPLLDELRSEPSLDGYHLLDAARAEALERLDRPVEAADAYARAAERAPTRAERRYLERETTRLRGGRSSR